MMTSSAECAHVRPQHISIARLHGEACIDCGSVFGRPSRAAREAAADLRDTLGVAGLGSLSPMYGEHELEAPDAAQQVAARLRRAFQEATGGGFLDLITHPWCQRCGAEAAIELGDLPLDTARRLVRALQREEA